jgi:dTDP-4-amino-4,6-dideoxygalactose transaminase
MARKRIPLLDLSQTYSPMVPELVDAFRRFVESGQYILGGEVEAFEAECKAYIGARTAIGVSSGTDALLLALMTLGIGQGDEVICPSFTFFATAGSIWRTGARPVFVDSALDDFNCTADDIAAKVTPRTKAIIPVHLFGQCADMDPIMALAQQQQIAIIEDAAQAIGSRYRGRSAGTIGTFGCFSFFPSKNLGGFGDAGLVTSNDEALGERARILRSHGSKPKYFHHYVGGNFRIDALQATLLRVNLRHLDGWTEARRRNASAYVERFAAHRFAAPNRDAKSAAPLLYPVIKQENHIFNQFVIRVLDGKRDALKQHLADNGIATEIYYPVPMHRQKCFASLGHGENDLPNSDRLAREALALPIHPGLTADDIDYVVTTTARFLS